MIDEMMGAGKTSAMLNYINAAPRGKRFVFVTPFLDEGKRLMLRCAQKDFQIPEAYDEDDPFHKRNPRSKMIDFKRFLKQRRNIVTTHALFERLDEETVQLIRDGGYTLIMDEVASAIEKYEISPYDTKTLLQKYVDIEDSKQLAWKQTYEQYYGKFMKYKTACDSGCLWHYSGKIIIKMIPISAFTAFSDVYIMTYMFDAQFHKYYFDLFGIIWQRKYVTGNSVDTYMLSDQPQHAAYPDLSQLIHICDNPKLNEIGNQTKALSRGWYQRNQDKSKMTEIRNFCYTFLRRSACAKADDALFTVFKDKPPTWCKNDDRKPYFYPPNYKSSFLACNARATNNYRTRTALAYPINRYMDPNIRNFLTGKGVSVDEDRWALSEMIQWIWRSAIRDGKEIWIYVPSKRMRTRLKNWIEEASDKTAATSINPVETETGDKMIQKEDAA